MKKIFKTSTLMKAIDRESGPLILVEMGNWVVDGKYSRCRTVLRDEKDRFWMFYQWMSGSPFTDYYHWYEDIKEMKLEQVEQKKRIEKYWSVVK